MRSEWVIAKRTADDLLTEVSAHRMACALQSHRQSHSRPFGGVHLENIEKG
jgi:hypothetical protein